MLLVTVDTRQKFYKSSLVWFDGLCVDTLFMLAGEDWWHLLLHLLTEEPPTVEGEREATLRFAEIQQTLQPQSEHDSYTSTPDKSL